MSTQTIASTIRSRFKTLIATPHSLPTQYDNENETKQTDLWCRLSILFGDSFQASIGAPSSNRYRDTGVVVAQLFLPLGKGDKQLYQTAGYIKTAFKSVSVSGVVFRTPSVKRVGRSENFWQVNVSCPFYADEIG